MIWLARRSSLGAGFDRPPRHALDLRRRRDLVGEVHRRHGQRALERAHCGQVLLVAHDDAADAHALGALHRGLQQLVGLLAGLVRAEPVRVVVVDGVDGRQLDEVADVDGLRRVRAQVVELLRVHDHVVPLRHLEALLDLLLGDRLPGGRRHLLVADPGPRVLLQLVEVDGVVMDGAVGLHGHVDQPEADRATPDRSSHPTALPAQGPVHARQACVTSGARWYGSMTTSASRRRRSARCSRP